MEGDIAPLNQITELASQYNAKIYIDDAHSIGVLGEMGHGTASHFNLTKKVDVIMGTFSKSFASIGGFIAANDDDCNFVRHTARTFIFSASPSPPAIATVLAVLDIIEKDDSYRQRLWENSKQLRDGLKAAGFTLGNAQTAIVPIIVGEQFKTARFWRELMDYKPKGVFTNPVLSPATQIGHELIRLTTMATMTKEIIAEALETLVAIGKKLKVI